LKFSYSTIATMKLLPQISPTAANAKVGFLKDFVGCFAQSNGWVRLFQPLM